MSQHWHTLNIVVVERVPMVGGHTEERVRAYEYELFFESAKVEWSGRRGVFKSGRQWLECKVTFLVKNPR